MPMSCRSAEMRTGRGRRERGEAAAREAQLVAVLATADAVAHVAAREPAGADAAAVRGGQVGADLAAGGVARLERLGEADARADEQRLDGGDGDAERAGELRVGEALELAHEQRRALLLGQAAHVVDQAAEVLAALGLGERVVQRRARHVHDVGRGRRHGGAAGRCSGCGRRGRARRAASRAGRRRAARRTPGGRRPGARPRRPAASRRASAACTRTGAGGSDHG